MNALLVAVGLSLMQAAFPVPRETPGNPTNVPAQVQKETANEKSAAATPGRPKSTAPQSNQEGKPGHVIVDSIPSIGKTTGTRCISSPPAVWSL